MIRSYESKSPDAKPSEPWACRAGIDLSQVIAISSFGSVAPDHLELLLSTGSHLIIHSEFERFVRDWEIARGAARR